MDLPWRVPEPKRRKTEQLPPPEVAKKETTGVAGPVIHWSDLHLDLVQGIFKHFYTLQRVKYRRLRGRQTKRTRLLPEVAHVFTVIGWKRAPLDLTMANETVSSGWNKLLLDEGASSSSVLSLRKSELALWKNFCRKTPKQRNLTSKLNFFTCQITPRTKTVFIDLQDVHLERPIFTDSRTRFPGIMQSFKWNSKLDRPVPELLKHHSQITKIVLGNFSLDFTDVLDVERDPNILHMLGCGPRLDAGRSVTVGKVSVRFYDFGAFDIPVVSDTMLPFPTTTLKGGNEEKYYETLRESWMKVVWPFPKEQLQWLNLCSVANLPFGYMAMDFLSKNVRGKLPQKEEDLVNKDMEFCFLARGLVVCRLADKIFTITSVMNYAYQLTRRPVEHLVPPPPCPFFWDGLHV